MKSVIVVFDGSNRQGDLARAIFLATGKQPLMVAASENELPANVDIVFLPGGFSYGDYLRAGAMAAKTPIMQAVKKFGTGGGRVLGICNGFQILCEAGLLPGLLRPNNKGQFICRWQGLKSAPEFSSLFASDNIIFPIAHGDGNFQINGGGAGGDAGGDDEVKKLQDGGQVLFYYDQNPNGSAGDIAGVCNSGKNIFGMMPHPENHIEDFHQPSFVPHDGGDKTKKDGLVFFKNFFDATM